MEIIIICILGLIALCSIISIIMRLYTYFETKRVWKILYSIRKEIVKIKLKEMSQSE